MSILLLAISTAMFSSLFAVGIIMLGVILLSLKHYVDGAYPVYKVDALFGITVLEKLGFKVNPKTGESEKIDPHLL
jgi:uncharacterized membrane protein YiaA